MLKRLFRLWWGVCLIQMLVPVSGSAVSDRNTGDAYRFQDIVVSATRYEKETFEAAVPAAALNSEKIEKIAPRSMGDLLSQIPGVYAAADGALGTGKPVVRGFHGNRVLVMIDGQRMQSSMGGIWGGADVSLIDPDLLERVEVVYGPGSSLYGSDALGGALNLITKRARLAEKAYRNYALNTYFITNGRGHRENFRAEAGGRRFAVGISASNRLMNDYRNPDETMHDSGFKMRSAAFDAAYSPRENHTLYLTVQANRNRNLERPTTISPAAETTIETNEYNRTKAGLDYEWTDITAVIRKLKLSTYYQEDDSEFSFNGDIHPLPLLSIDSGSRGDSTLETTGVMGHIEAAFSRVYAIAGFDYYHNSSGPNKTRSRSTTRVLGIPRPEKRSTSIAEDGSVDSFGLYVQNEFFLSDTLTLTLGLRYDRYRSRYSPHGDSAGTSSRSKSDSALTGSLGVMYAPTTWLRWYVNVARGFRAPSLRDMFYRGTVPGGLLSKGNPSLDPETSLTYNTGFKIKTARFQGSIGIFRSDVDDLIIGVNRPPGEQSDPPGGVVVRENLGKARLWGGEAWFSFLICRGITYSADYTYTQGKDMVNRWPLQAVPPARLSQTLRWENNGTLTGGLPVWAELQCTYRFRQHRIARDWDKRNMRTPGHAKWDLRVGMELPRCRAYKRCDLYLAVTNITGKRYTEIALYDGYDLLYMPGVGATLGLKLRW